VTTKASTSDDDSLHIRPYTGPRDHAEMVRVRNAALRRNGQPADATVTGMDAKYANLQQDLALDCALAVFAGRIVAYARTSAEDLASGDQQAAIIILADPDAPELVRGVQMVFDASLRRAVEQLEDMPRDQTTRILCSFPASDAASRAAVQRAGFREARRETVLVRDTLAAIPTVALPEGITLEPVDRSDRAQQRQAFTAALRASSDRWGARETADDWFGATIDAPGFDASLWRVAVHGSDVAGVVLNGLEEPGDDGSQVEWTELIAIDPAHRETALARALLAETLRGFRDAGATSAALLVDLLDPGGDEALFASFGYRIASATLEYLAGPFEPGAFPTLVGGRVRLMTGSVDPLQ